MKSIPLAALTLALPLVLSGCSSSPSLEDQAKLVEYEQCLRYEPEHVSKMIEVELNRVDSPLKEIKRQSFQEYLKETSFEELLKSCKQYRP